MLDYANNFMLCVIFYQYIIISYESQLYQSLT